MYGFEDYPEDSEAYVISKRYETEKIARRIANEKTLDYGKLNFAQRNALRYQAVLQLCENTFQKVGD